MYEMTEHERRAYGIGKDAFLNREKLDEVLDWACAEGIVPDTLTVDRHACMGWAAAEYASLGRS
ncbi:hypothetical protein SEA_LEMOND_91 [Mycobacterium phage LeMond]|uniref:Uncharacterized protein n=1 Tax=Mycobacterium phage KiSi TaxID=2507856 RepID=A0A410TBS8_9CAUD|nr:hypothetical protein I5G98_gp016 [Mycobacterium phage KiSi]AYR01156.1 hypothetical protein SEA_LEMOND_91 [Mycobacterium phage LeMond]AYR01259.1 hypothetical protein SEA_OSCAR_92 [Mycobacterium phage Oscar]AYR01691.1 hypothetical protein SEA_SCARLETT_91 [Mycobacterium phage Scarlett]QAU06510.1 hypothetical protein SEA_KISI_92 [Mycobacterium phage KiSi]